MDNCEESLPIAQLSDTVIALERDQQSGSEHSDTVVRVLKNHYSGETGVIYADYVTISPPANS